MQETIQEIKKGIQESIQETPKSIQEIKIFKNLPIEILEQIRLFPKISLIELAGTMAIPYGA